MNVLIERLLHSAEPSIRYKIRAHVLGENPRGAKLRKLHAEIAASPRVKALLSERNRRGEIPHFPYAKWHGAHWGLVALAELEYPPGDKSLIPLREQVLEFLFSDRYARWIRHVKGITRIHASIDGNAIWAQ